MRIIFYLFFSAFIFTALPPAAGLSEEVSPSAEPQIVRADDPATSDTPPSEEIQPDISETPDSMSYEEFQSAPAAGSTNLFSTVKQGGPMMIFIIFLGLISLTIIIERVIFFTRNRIWFGEHLSEMLTAEKDNSAARFKEDLEDDLKSAYREYSDSMEKGLSLLSGLGYIAPILGFLGTVVGMIKAFAAIAAATTVNAKVVAVGIQIALVTTAGGLMVAAPTLAAYYLFMHVIQNRYADADRIINGLTEGLPRLSDTVREEV